MRIKNVDNILWVRKIQGKLTLHYICIIECTKHFIKRIVMTKGSRIKIAVLEKYDLIYNIILGFRFFFFITVQSMRTSCS